MESNKQPPELPHNPGRSEFDDESSNSNTRPVPSDVSLQNLILSAVKLFVSKSNKKRHALYGGTQDYKSYNYELVIREFLGLKLYSLVVPTPKTYISLDENNDLEINSEIKGNTQSLNQYLCAAIKKAYPNSKIDKITADVFNDDDLKGVLRAAINKLEGVGELCFMALWLQDFDAFGRALDNVLIEDDKRVKKIDASEINLMPAPDFNEQVDALKTHSKYPYYYKNPFFADIFGLLDEKQLEAGFYAVGLMRGDDFQKQLEWVRHALNLDENTFETFKKVLNERRMYMLESFMPENLEKPTKKLNSVEQQVVLRPKAHFESMGQTIEGGNSKPTVTKKTHSEKKEKQYLLMLAWSSIGSLISILEERLQRGEAKDKEKLKMAITQLNELNDFISEKAKPEKEGKKSFKREDIAKIYQDFNRIVANYVDPALTVSEIDKLVSSLFSLVSKKEPNLSGSQKGATNQDIETLKTSLNTKFAGFFDNALSFSPNAGAQKSDMPAKKTNQNK